MLYYNVKLVKYRFTNKYSGMGGIHPIFNF